MNWPSHGANPQYIYEKMNLKLPDNYIDFSANINPLGPPTTVRTQFPNWFSTITEYPDPEARQLKAKIAAKEGLVSEQVVVGNGGAELITLIAQQLAGKTVLVIQPAFSEYEEACRVNGCQVRSIFMNTQSWSVHLEELLEQLHEVDAIFLCNPNNPTGVCWPKSWLEELAHGCEQHETYLIIDEAFYDFVPGYESLVPLLKNHDYLVLLRSMTKMFAIPGLRLGYVLSSASFVTSIVKTKPHWSVNALALQAGLVCLEEEEFVKQSVELILEERCKLFAFYKEFDFEYSPSSVNFYLLKDHNVDDQMRFFQYLLKHGMIARHTMNFPGLDGGWLRFAVKGVRENERLMEVIQQWRIKEN